MMILLISSCTGLPTTEEAELTSILSGVLIFVYLCCHILYSSTVYLMYTNSFPMLISCILKKSLFRVLFVIIMCSRFLLLLFFTGRK